MSIYKSEHTDQPGPWRRWWWRFLDKIFGWKQCGSSIYNALGAEKWDRPVLYCRLPRWHPGKHSNKADSLRWGYGDDLGEWWGRK